jgi:hypothetical protein
MAFSLLAFHVAFYQGMNTETGYGMASTIQENSIARRAIRDERNKRFLL